jgi:hypothetical protein
VGLGVEAVTVWSPTEGCTPGQTHEGLRSYDWGTFGEVTGAETLQNPERGGISEQSADRS